MLMAYPNPAKGLLTLKFKRGESSEFLAESVQIFSETSDQVIRTIPVFDSNSHKSLIKGNEIEINVESLKRGTYFIHVQPQKKSEKKVEKIRIELE